MKKIEPKRKSFKEIGEELEQDFSRIDDIEEELPEKVWMSGKAFFEALKAAYRQGRAEALKEYEEVELKDVLERYIPAIKASV